MAEEQRNEPIDPEEVNPETAAPAASPRRRLSIPPRFRTWPWLLGGGGVGILLLGLVLNFAVAAASAPDTPPPTPTPQAAPTPTPDLSLLPDRPTPTPLPSQYAFTHFVSEMAACYEQNGQAATLEEVEADIMVDVPLAVNELMKLYAENRCVEEDPWHQIPGRVGWMLRAADVSLR